MVFVHPHLWFWVTQNNFTTSLISCLHTDVLRTCQSKVSSNLIFLVPYQIETLFIFDEVSEMLSLKYPWGVGGLGGGCHTSFQGCKNVFFLHLTTKFDKNIVNPRVSSKKWSIRKIKICDFYQLFNHLGWPRCVTENWGPEFTWMRELVNGKISLGRLGREAFTLALIM